MAEQQPERRPGRPRTRDKLLEQRAADPIGSLTPTGDRILRAAQRVLERDGFAALSLSAIATEADESKASIGYHFGNKDGLIVALVDSLVREANRGLNTEPEDPADDNHRLNVPMEGELRTLADRRSFVALLEILPHAMRDESLRHRVAELYGGYRAVVLGAIGAEADGDQVTLSSFAALTIAVVDGLSIQRALDPKQIDVEAATALWLGMARGLLADRGFTDLG
jgi:AcrR family transcriptional regulator